LSGNNSGGRTRSATIVGGSGNLVGCSDSLGARIGIACTHNRRRSKRAINRARRSGAAQTCLHKSFGKLTCSTGGGGSGDMPGLGISTGVAATGTNASGGTDKRSTAIEITGTRRNGTSGTAVLRGCDHCTGLGASSTRGRTSRPRDNAINWTGLSVARL